MNKIPASVFILCIIKIQEFCYKYGYLNYSFVAEQLIDACNIDGKEIGKSITTFLDELRNSEPFLSLDISQESFVYATFKQLKSGI